MRQEKKKMEIPMEKPEFEKICIKEGLYDDATLKEIKEISPGKYGERVAIIFEVTTLEGPRELAKIVYKKLTPGSAFMGVLETMGYKWEEGVHFNTDKLIGKKARVLVENYECDDKQMASIISKVKKQEEPEEEVDEVPSTQIPKEGEKSSSE